MRAHANVQREQHAGRGFDLRRDLLDVRGVRVGSDCDLIRDGDAVLHERLLHLLVALGRAAAEDLLVAHRQQQPRLAAIERHQALVIAHEREAALRDLVADGCGRRVADARAPILLRTRRRAIENGQPLLRAQDAQHGVIDASLRQAARGHRGQHRIARRERIGRHQQHVRAREQRAHRDFAGRDLVLHAAHVERVGHDEARERELFAQHAGQDRLAQRRWHCGVFAEARHRQVARHHRRESAVDRRAERRELARAQQFAGSWHRRQIEVRVRVHVAVAREVLAARERARVHLDALRKRAAHARDERSVLAKAAHVDDRVLGIAVHVEHGSQHPRRAERARFLAGHATHRARKPFFAGGADQHLVAHLRGARQPERDAGLKVARDEQRQARR